MAFPTKTNKQSLAEAFEEIQRIAHHVKASAVATNVTLSQQQTEARSLVSMTNQLSISYRRLLELSRVPGLLAYANAETFDEEIDFPAEFTAMTDAIAAVITWVRTNVPRDIDGYLLVETMDERGLVRSRVYSVNNLAPLRALLDTVIGTIQ